MDHSFNGNPRASSFSRSMLAFVVFLGIALFFLLSEHRIHALGWLPLLFLAACPLLHMFHHGGHGGHGGHGKHARDGSGQQGRGTVSPEPPGDPARGQAEETI